MKKIFFILGKNSLEIICLILFALIILLENNFLLVYNSYSAGIGLYFYSSLLQANAALISIVAIFFIFRIQSLQSTVEGYYNALIASSVNNLERKFYHSFRSHTLEEKIIDVEKGNFNEEVHKEIMLSCIDNIKRIKCTKYAIIYPVIFLTVAIIINIIGLLLTNYLNSFGSALEIKIFLLVLVLEIYCLFSLIKGIYKSIKSDAI